jgi:hypothetical protein
VTPFSRLLDASARVDRAGGEREIAGLDSSDHMGRKSLVGVADRVAGRTAARLRGS